MTDNNNDASNPPEAESFPSFASLKTAHSELLESEPENANDTKYFDSVEQFFNKARATGELLSDEEERRAAQSILNYWLTVLYRADRKPQYIILAQLKPDLRPNLKDAECPYPGPREFNEAESKYFFGRYSQIEYMLARFKLESILALLGPSGGGKTSLVQAGLIPALRRRDREDEPEGGPSYFLPVITPGKNPLRNLSVMLKQAKLGPEEDSDKHYEKMRATPAYLASMIREHLKVPVVIIVDQFEEVFTLCQDQQLRQGFAESLMGLNDGKNKIILCMTNDDYNHELNKLPALKEYFKRASTVLPKLGLSELTDAIVKPAEIAGLKFKERTVKDIVQEIASETVALPLLQFALLKLWDKRVGDETPDQFYLRVGGCHQILSQSAATFFDGLSPEQQVAARKVLSRLIKIDESGAHSQIVLRERLEEIEMGDQVIARMEKEHLVRLTKSARPSDVQVEIVHGSLLSYWSVMKQLIEEKQRRHNAYRMLRTLILLLVLVFLGYWAYNIIENREHERRTDAATKWAAESGNELTADNIELALMLALAAYKTDDNPSTRGALLEILRYGTMPKAFIKPSPEQTMGAWQMLARLLPKTLFNQEPVMTGDVALSADGQLLAANDDKGLIIIWDLSHGREPRPPIHDDDAPKKKSIIVPLAFGPDGQLLASGTNSDLDGERVAAVALWDAASGRRVGTLKAKKGIQLNCIVFDPDGQRVAAGDDNGDVYLWEIADSSLLRLPHKHEDGINDLRFSADGQLLASGSSDASVIIWDVKSGHPRRTLKYSCDCLKAVGDVSKAITGLAFGHQDNRLYVGSTKDVVLYDVNTGEAISALISDQNVEGMFLSLSDDDRTLQGIDSQGYFYLWDVKEARNSRIIRKKLFKWVPAAWSIAFSHDGSTLALSGEDGLSAWNLAWQRPLPGRDTNVNGIAFSPDGRALASAGNTGSNGKVTLWDAASHKIRRELSNGNPAAYGVAFSHTGNLLAAESVTGSVGLWKVADEEDAGNFLVPPNELVNLEGLPQEPSAFTFTPDDRTVISLSTYHNGDETNVFLNAWDVEQRRLLNAPLKLPLPAGSEVMSAAFSSDGRVLALSTEGKGSGERVVTLWEPLKGTQLKPLSDPFKSGITSLALSGDGTWVAAGDEDGRVVIWNRQIGERQVMPFAGRLGSISNLAFSDDGETLSVSIESDIDNVRTVGMSSKIHTVVLWDISLKTLSLLDKILSPNQPRIVLRQLGRLFNIEGFSFTNALVFSPNGQQLAIADDNKNLTILNLDVSGAEAMICGITDRKFTPEELTRYQAAIELTNPCQQTSAAQAGGH